MLRLPIAVAAIAFAVCSLTTPRAVEAVEYNVYQVVQGTPVSTPESHVELTKVSMVREIPREVLDKDNLVGNSAYDEECVQFVNHDARVATQLVVRFSYRDANGGEVGYDAMTVRGRFSPGLTHGNIGGYGRSETCYVYREEFGLTWVGKEFAWYQKGVVALTASVDEVEYADGTSWRGLHLAGDGYLGAILQRAWAQPDSPVEIRSSFAVNFDGANGSACVFFVNQGTRTATHVRFTLSFRSNDAALSKEFGTDILDVSGSFAPNVPVEPWPSPPTAPSAVCRPFPGAVRTPRKPFFGNQPDPVIHYASADRDVVLVAGVKAVDFDDGSSWVAP